MLREFRRNLLFGVHPISVWLRDSPFAINAIGSMLTFAAATLSVVRIAVVHAVLYVYVDCRQSTPNYQTCTHTMHARRLRVRTFIHHFLMHTIFALDLIVSKYLKWLLVVVGDSGGGFFLLLLGFIFAARLYVRVCVRWFSSVHNPYTRNAYVWKGTEVDRTSGSATRDSVHTVEWSRCTIERILYIALHTSSSARLLFVFFCSLLLLFEFHTPIQWETLRKMMQKQEKKSTLWISNVRKTSCILNLIQKMVIYSHCLWLPSTRFHFFSL